MDEDEIATMRALLEKHPEQAAYFIAELAAKPTDRGEALIAQLLELLIKMHPKTTLAVVTRLYGGAKN